MVSLATLTAVVLLSAVAPAQVLQQRIVNPVAGATATDHWFGYSVDISGDALIVGAPSDLYEFSTTISGVAIYERIGGTWTPTLDLLQAFPADRHSGWDVAIDGEWAAFNVFGQDGSLVPGEVRIYRRVAGNWVSTQTLTAPIRGFDSEYFGNAIDIDGELMAVGSVGQEIVWLYRLVGSTWIQDGLVQAPPFYLQVANFGESVAIQDLPTREVVIVGQPLFSVNPELDDGAAHIYRNLPIQGWTPINSHTCSLPPIEGSWFGWRVALDGDFAAVGAVNYLETAFPFTGRGAAMIYRWNGNTFPLSKELFGNEKEYLGWAVAADGDRVYLARPGFTGIDAGPPYLDAGRATGHRWTGSTWEPWPAGGGSFHRIAQPLVDTYFGESMAASDGRVVVGARRATVAGVDDAGSIFVIDATKEGWKWSDADVGGLDTVVGATGPARLIGEGSLGGGDGYRLHLHGALPSTLVALFVGLSAVNAPFKGGVLVPNPQYTLYFPTNASGAFHVTAVFPNGLPAGVSLWHHMWWPDPAGPAGFASSNAVRGITP